MSYSKAKRPPPGKVANDRADDRCPMLECVWARNSGKNYIAFDCNNQHPTRFCKASTYPWSPSGDADKPIPPMAGEDWTEHAQRVWQNHRSTYPFYKPPHSPLPFTIAKYEPRNMPPSPPPYELDVPAPGHREDDTTSASGLVPHSPPPKLQSRARNFFLALDAPGDRREDDGSEQEDSPDEAEVNRSPIRTRSRSRKANSKPQDKKPTPAANTTVLKAVPATDEDRRFFLDECFQNEHGEWMKYDDS